MCKPNRPILFIAQDGMDLPTARVRCFGFARYLARQGFNTSILSYRDDLHASRHGVELSLMGRWEQIALNLRAFPRLMRSPGRPIMYVQKVNYHCLAPKLVAKLRRLPMVVDFDDLEYQPHRPCCWQNRLIRHMLRSAAACITGSHHLYCWLRDHAASVHLVYTGVDTDCFTPPTNESQRIAGLATPTLAWSGGVFDALTLEAARGVLEFFDALHRINPHTQLLLLVYGSRLPQLASLIQAHRITGCIELVPHVAPLDIPRWLARAHAGMFYFPTVTPWVKAKSPTKLFEYMACGVVPVCGRGTEADHVVADGRDGILFDQIQDGAFRLARLFESRDQWAAMSARAAQKAVSQFSLSVQTDRLARLLRTLDHHSSPGERQQDPRRS